MLQQTYSQLSYFVFLSDLPTDIQFSGIASIPHWFFQKYKANFEKEKH